MNKKGISLIVLSITILVMAILAATAIIALEDSGIIGRSKNTVSKQNYNEEYTRLQVIKNGILTDNLGTITVDEYVTELSNKGLIESGVTTNADGSKSVTTKTGFEVIISQNGTSDLNIVIDGYTPPSNNTGNNTGNSGNSSGNVPTTTYELSGVWKFNDTINCNGLNDYYPINFTMKDMSGSEIGVLEVESSVSYTLYWDSLRIDESVYVYLEDEWVNYISQSEYSIEEIKTVDFGSTPQVVSEEFYNWFTANATQGTNTGGLITFTVDGVSYQAETGTTWGDWTSTSYNTGGFYLEVPSNDVLSSNSLYIYNPDVNFDGGLMSEEIIAGADYYSAYGHKFYVDYYGEEKEYYYSEKMTWADFVNHIYSYTEFTIDGSNIVYEGGPHIFFNGYEVLITDAISEDALYTAGSGTCCFDPGVQVLMADGTTKNIEDVRVGDMVMSLNEDTGEYISQRVTSTIIKHNSDDLVYVNLSNGTRIGMRAYHPLLTIEGWKSLRPTLAETIMEAGRVDLLEVGDVLIGYEENVKIVSIETRENIPNYNTYNLSVEGYHNYIVNGVVAHNYEPCEGVIPEID